MAPLPKNIDSSAFFKSHILPLHHPLYNKSNRFDFQIS